MSLQPRTVESERLDQANVGEAVWRRWGTISERASGAPYAKTIARMEMPGATSLMTRHVHELISGEKMDSPESAMTSSGYASVWPCGTKETQS